MDKIKEFIKEHNKELIYIGSGILIYNIGFKKGFNTAKDAISHVFDEAARTLPVAKF